MMSTREKQQKTLYRLVFSALMAAMVFVSTSFLKVDIVTPVGPTMLKSGNIVCLLSGLLFGGVPGGLAAGVGSMLFDLLDPRYIADAPWTLIRFGLMGAMCGWIAHSGGAKGLSFRRNLVATVSASVFSFVFYVIKSVIDLLLAGSAFAPAVVAVVPKMVTSGINYIVAIVVALLLAVPLNKALDKAGMLDKI